MLVSMRFVWAFPRSAPCRLVPLLGVLVMSATYSSGCGRDAPPPETEVRLRKLLNPLLDYTEATGRQGAGKSNEEGFKKFLAGLSKQKLADLTITNTEELFVSPRDQQPFVINYDIPVGGGSGPAAWEQVGEGGRRYILYQNGKVEEIDEGSFATLGLRARK